MPDTQREWDEMNIEAKAEADEAMAAWEQEFLGHRAGGTLQAPSPQTWQQPGQQPGQPMEPAQPGGAPDVVAPTSGGSDMGGPNSSAPMPGAGGGSAPGGY